jgi:hypothetical protein
MPRQLIYVLISRQILSAEDLQLTQNLEYLKELVTGSGCIGFRFDPGDRLKRFFDRIFEKLLGRLTRKIHLGTHSNGAWQQRKLKLNT